MKAPKGNNADKYRLEQLSYINKTAKALVTNTPNIDIAIPKAPLVRSPANDDFCTKTPYSSGFMTKLDT